MAIIDTCHRPTRCGSSSRDRAGRGALTPVTFREMNSALVPLLAAAVTALAFATAAGVDEGWASAVVRGATWVLLGIGFWTFLWTYASLQLGLDRLGRERVVPDAARVVDPGLGLQPLGQMVELKANELGIARELYAAAYEPVRAAQTLEALDEQRSLLGAADALEKRAHAIHEWPIDEGTWARVLTIVTSVTAITIGRLILDPLGF